MTSGVWIRDNLWDTILDEDVQLLKHLHDAYSLKAGDRKYDGYIYETYQCFIRHKRNIYLNYTHLREEPFDSINKEIMRTFGCKLDIVQK